MRLQGLRQKSWVVVLATLAGLPWAGLPAAPGRGIAWYPRSVDDAFAAAAKAQRPVFLYWGAKWCPPCNQLKAWVFSRTDFIDKSRQFVAVYLDGDDPGAQHWGERFHVMGYPAVLILRPDGKEVMRITGALDLASYAQALDVALADDEPIADVLAALRRSSAPPARADCQRLAYNDWDGSNISAGDLEPMARQLVSASERCTSLTQVERARLLIAAASLLPSADVVRLVIDIVEDPSLSRQLVNALEGLREPFFNAVRARGDEAATRFQTAWVNAMQAAANDPQVIDSEQLVALGTQLAGIKALSHDRAIPADVATAARARVSAALRRTADASTRPGLVEGAAYAYEQLGDLDALYALAKQEMATAKAPYYYMNALGETEEERGHKDEALMWYGRAYEHAQGVATRFQWGSEYLAALLRLAPADHVRIQMVGAAVIAELDGPERIQARTRVKLEKLDGRVRKWNAEHQYDADVDFLRRRMRAVCAKLPQDDTGRPSCEKFLT